MATDVKTLQKNKNIETSNEFMENPFIVPLNYKWDGKTAPETIVTDSGKTLKVFLFEDQDNTDNKKICVREVVSATIASKLEKAVRNGFAYYKLRINTDKHKNIISWLNEAYIDKINETGDAEEVFAVGNTVQSELFIKVDEQGNKYNVSTTSTMNSSFEFDEETLEEAKEVVEALNETYGIQS